MPVLTPYTGCPPASARRAAVALPPHPGQQPGLDADLLAGRHGPDQAGIRPAGLGDLRRGPH